MLGGSGHQPTQQIVRDQEQQEFPLHHFGGARFELFHAQRGFEVIQTHFQAPSFQEGARYFPCGIEFGIQKGRDQRDFPAAKAGPIDFDLNDVNSQVTALQKESSSFIFNNPLKASSSKDHSNETLSRNEPLGIEEEALYAINNTSERRILLLKELNIKLGK